MALSKKKESIEGFNASTGNNEFVLGRVLSEFEDVAAEYSNIKMSLNSFIARVVETIFEAAPDSGDENSIKELIKSELTEFIADDISAM